jgi:hypothetical protein
MTYSLCVQECQYGMEPMPARFLRKQKHGLGQMPTGHFLKTKIHCDHCGQNALHQIKSLKESGPQRHFFRVKIHGDHCDPNASHQIKNFEESGPRLRPPSLEREEEAEVPR